MQKEYEISILLLSISLKCGCVGLHGLLIVH